MVFSRSRLTLQDFVFGEPVIQVETPGTFKNGGQEGKTPNTSSYEI